MFRRAPPRAAALAMLVAIGLGAVAIQGCSGSGRRSPPAGRSAPAGRARPGAHLPAGAQTITVGDRPVGRGIPPGFLGLSLEFGSVWQYVGTDPSLLDRLIRNLDPGQAPVLRIGGDSTDRGWWPVRGVPHPPGIRFALGPYWLADVRRLADSLDARLILGLNFEADSGAVAAAEARVFKQAFGPRIEALELGNEPDLYSSFGWYRRPAGNTVPGRAPGYDFSAFLHDFVHVARALPHAPLAGPALGTPPWTRYMGRLLSAEPRLSLLTLHRYPLQACFTTPASPRYPTIRNLLATRSTEGLAHALEPAITAAHRRGISVRLDEINSVACRGSPGVSDTFASALWALEVTFDLAEVGVDGVNFHTFPSAVYQLFSFDGTASGRTARVYPEYYGLMMFAQAAPPGSRLLPTTGPHSAHLGVWATRDSGTTRVALVNDSSTQARVVALSVPAADGPGSLERLTAPALDATAGMSLGGRSFGAQTASGILTGQSRMTLLRRVAGCYLIRLAPASAALLTVTRPGLGGSVGDAAAVSPGGQLQQHG